MDMFTSYMAPSLGALAVSALPWRRAAEAGAIDKKVGVVLKQMKASTAGHARKEAIYMADQHTSKSSEPHTSPALSRRHFLQGTGLTAAGVLGLLQGHPAHGAPAASGASPRALGSRPNFLILMVDEMRYPQSMSPRPPRRSASSTSRRRIPCAGTASSSTGIMPPRSPARRAGRRSTPAITRRCTG